MRDDLTVGAAQPLPVDDGVALGDAERTCHAGAGLAATGEQGLVLGGVADAAHLLGEAVEPADAAAGPGDERAASRDPLEQALDDQRVHGLAHGHPGHAELLHQLALGGGRGAGFGVTHEGADVLTHLYVLEGAASRGVEQLFHNHER